MSRSLLPPGYRFHPTDVELIRYYLRRKVMHKRILGDAISEVELYKFSPWDLPDKSCSQSRDLEWYFFCPRDRKYTNGSRMNRATETGYWKTTGKDRCVTHNSQPIGFKRTLIFHEGKAPQGSRTDWVMYEYRLEDKELVGYSQDSYVLCRIFKKSGPGPKNGEQYGAPYQDEDWDDEVVNYSSVPIPCLTSSVPEPTDCENAPLLNSMVGSEDQFGPLLEPSDPHQSEISGLGPLDDDGDAGYIDVEKLLQELADDISNDHAKDSDELVLPGSTSVAESDALDIYGGLEDLSGQPDSLANMYFLNCMEDGAALQQMFTGVPTGCFLEMNDLEFPSEGIISGHAMIDEPCDYRVNSERMSVIGVPSFSIDSMVPSLPGINDNHSLLLQGNNTFASDLASTPEILASGIGMNNEHQVATHNQDAEETGYRFALESFPEGEQSNTLTNLERVTSTRKPSYSRLQQLLDSIPAHPASAAECPSHAKAGVKMGCACFNNGPVERPGSCSCTCCNSCSLAKRRGTHTSSASGFMYVFLLGMVTAFMWLFFVALIAKLGRYVWVLSVS
ncbi:NAC domain-containing protein 78 [Acorus gramineus]|uniref:NAC domain-containing protein 78 n=1 Tax=Acorus gramineus TaxID=55184 RepID=A0AAV9ARR3_ACOGR|nr:NAC domain-containing protein 78 [Acorus gramineus]